MGGKTQIEVTLHVKVPGEWYEALRDLSEKCEGTIHQQAKLAIRERLERVSAIPKRACAS